MALVDLKTDLKTLKYSQFGDAAPLVQKDHTKAGNLYNSVPREITARTDDLARLTQLVGKRPKFFLNQVLLRTTGNTLKERAQSLGNAAGGALGTVTSFISQAGVAGTGVHLIHETDLIKTSLNGYYIGEQGAKNAQAGTSILDTKVTSKYEIIPEESRQKKENREVRIITDIGSTIFQDETSTVNLVSPSPNFFSSNYTNELTSEEKRKGSITIKTSNALENKFNTTTKNRSDYINSLDPTINPNLPDIIKNEFIPFRIQVLSTENALDESSEWLFFRAYLDGFDDSVTGDWSSIKYIGRAENFYTYSGFDRKIGFAFKIAAESKAEIEPLYRKLNRLLGTTSPTYSSQSTFMKGIFTRLTIGDYIQRLPGFFTSIQVTWNTSYPWEINLKDNPSDPDSIIVPHVLDINCSYQPVHDFNPEYGKSFIVPSILQEEISL